MNNDDDDNDGKTMSFHHCRETLML